MKLLMRLIWQMCSIPFLVTGLALGFDSSVQATPVSVLSINGSIGSGTAVFVENGIADAEKNGAGALILDINSSGGSTDGADEISAALQASERYIPSVAFIKHNATGPAVLIALSCTKIAMSPGSIIGGPVDPALLSNIRSAAEAHRRNEVIISSFAGAEQQGTLGATASAQSVDLTANEALTLKVSDATINDYTSAAGLVNIATPVFNFESISPLEQFALWLIQPWVTILFLVVGLALLIWEIATWHTWGLAAIAGGVIVTMILLANIVAGSGTWVGGVLILAGIALLLFETHFAPGHFIPSAIGMCLIFSGGYLALGGAHAGAAYTLGVSTLLTSATVVAFVIYLPKSKVWKKLGQSMRQTASGGYVAGEDYTAYVGQFGLSTSVLRPSGTAEIDGLRFSVQTEGEYVGAGVPIQVVAVQGGRITVSTTGHEDSLMSH